MAAWVEVFLRCHAATMSGWLRLEWPDGGTLSDQPALLVELFEVIHTAMIAEMSSGKRH